VEKEKTKSSGCIALVDNRRKGIQ